MSWTIRKKAGGRAGETSWDLAGKDIWEKEIVGDESAPSPGLESLLFILCRPSMWTRLSHLHCVKPVDNSSKKHPWEDGWFCYLSTELIREATWVPVYKEHNQNGPSTRGGWKSFAWAPVGVPVTSVWEVVSKASCGPGGSGDWGVVEVHVYFVGRQPCITMKCCVVNQSRDVGTVRGIREQLAQA